MQNMAMAYAVSKEKKREVITKMITELCVSDVNSIVKGRTAAADPQSV